MGHKSLGPLGLGEKSLGQFRDVELWDSSPRDKNLWDWQSRPMPIPDQDPVSWTFWSTTLDPIGHTEPSTDTDKRCTFAFFSDYLPGNFGYDKVLMKNDFKS